MSKLEHFFGAWDAGQHIGNDLTTSCLAELG